MRLVATACIVAAFGQDAQARDVALTLGWGDSAPAAELVAVARDGSGQVIDLVRQPIAPDTRAVVLSLPSLSRQTSTVQIGALVADGFALQSARVPLEGGQPPDRMTLTATLTASFAKDYLCSDGHILSLSQSGDGLRLTAPGLSLALTPTDLPGRYRAEDGSTLNRAPGLVQRAAPDGSLLDSCQPIPTRPILPLTALGPDGAWRVASGLDGSVLTRAADAPQAADSPPAPVATTVAVPQDDRITLAFGAYVLRLQNSPCRLPGTDMPFPFQASLAGPEIAQPQGCAGNPLWALEGPPWQVTHLFGYAVPRSAEGMTAFTLQFDTGRLSGRTSCNRYLGRAAVQGTQLVLSELGTTRLPCPANLRNLETRFLDALETATGLVRLPGGGVALYDGPMAVLVADR